MCYVLAALFFLKKEKKRDAITLAHLFFISLSSSMIYTGITHFYWLVFLVSF